MAGLNSIPSGYRLIAGLVGLMLGSSLSACDLPLNLGLPTTRGLESGALSSLTDAGSLEITGTYVEAKTRWSIDLQLTRSGTERVTATSSSLKLEAIILGKDAYFRGKDFLSAHMGSDLISRSFVQAAGNGWWRGAAGNVPKLTDLTDGKAFNSAFLGQAVTKRTDHLLIDGIDAVELSGARADVFIAAGPPYRVIRVVLKHGVVIDGIQDGDFKFTNYNLDFGIAVPVDVIDFSNLSTLPPIYTVLSVDTSGCPSPCAVSAVLRNLGGMRGARAPSTITFTMTDSASQRALGSCQAQVAPDVGYNATTTVGCTIDTGTAQSPNAAVVRAAADNPGRG